MQLQKGKSNDCIFVEIANCCWIEFDHSQTDPDTGTRTESYSNFQFNFYDKLSTHSHVRPRPVGSRVWQNRNELRNVIKSFYVETIRQFTRTHSVALRIDDVWFDNNDSELIEHCVLHWRLHSANIETYSKYVVDEAMHQLRLAIHLTIQTLKSSQWRCGSEMIWVSLLLMSQCRKLVVTQRQTFAKYDFTQIQLVSVRQIFAGCTFECIRLMTIECQPLNRWTIVGAVLSVTQWHKTTWEITNHIRVQFWTIVLHNSCYRVELWSVEWPLLNRFAFNRFAWEQFHRHQLQCSKGSVHNRMFEEQQQQRRK